MLVASAGSTMTTRPGPEPPQACTWVGVGEAGIDGPLGALAEPQPKEQSTAQAARVDVWRARRITGNCPHAPPRGQ
jgi:hypothetical protein